MKHRRIESVITLAVLLIVNFFTMLWLQGRPFATVWANGLNAPATAPLAAANIPLTFSYQGTLRDAKGNLLNGAFNLKLNLYKEVTGGSALHTESFSNVNVRAGIFSVVVGDATAIAPTVFDNYPLYLGISVNQDPEMLPRQRLHPVPFAMQSTSAQTAVTAKNLVQGGGVPNLVTLGTGGLSEIAFAPNSGKISDDASGLTLHGGINPSVKTAGNLAVGGDLSVAGDWSVSAILDKGDSNGGANVRSTYPISITRYVVEAPDNGASPDTVRLDDTILTALCQDEDGCKVNLYMRDWDPARKPGLLAGAGPYRWSLAAPVNGQRDWDMRTWGSETPGSGMDGNGVVNHLINIYSACYLVDGEYVNAVHTDNVLGFGLLNWHGAYDSVNMTCVLIIED